MEDLEAPAMGSVGSWISWKPGKVRMEAEGRERSWEWMESKNRSPAEGLTSWAQLESHLERAQETSQAAGNAVAASMAGWEPKFQMWSPMKAALPGSAPV